MNAVQGTPVNINGRTGGTPGPASTTVTRIEIPMPPGRARTPTLTNKSTTFARQLTIRNYDETIELRVRFYDDTFVSIPGESEKTFPGPISFFAISSASATAEWDATAIVAG